MRKRLISFVLAVVLLVGLCPAAFSASYTQMTFSDKCVQYIKNGEGFKANVYTDGTGWYIGYGCAVGKDDYPNGITEAQADAMLREKMSVFAADVNNFLKRNGIKASQGQFDALCSMTYNLGSVWLADTNTLPTMIRKGSENYSDEEIVSAFAAWCHIGNTVSEGLLRRRIAEAKMFLYDDYSGNSDGWKWLVATGAGGKVSRKINCYKTGGEYSALPTATRAGYTFAGWTTPNGTAITNKTTVSENLYVQAKWLEGENVEVPDPDLRFPDVKKSAWYYEYVERLAEEGTIGGYPDGTFKPGESVTWGQALKMVTLASGYPEKKAKDDEHWAAGYLSFAEARGYVKKDSVKNLNAEITRNEIAVLLAAYLELDTKGVSIENPFEDTTLSAALALYAEGIFEGSVDSKGDRYFKGADKIKRSEVSTALCRAMDYVAENFVCISGDRAKIDFSLKMQDYDPEKFFTEGDRIYYSDGNLDVRYGIDVSQHQYDIDWEAVAGDGVDFAIIRMGYRGYSKGALNVDPYFEDNIKEAIAAGIDVGVYFFSQAVSVKEALEEAEYVLEAIKAYDVSYPVVFDWEPMHYSGSRTDSYDGKVISDCAIAFMDRVAEAGYTPMMYYNKTMAYLKLDVVRLESYPTWLAQYAVEVPDYIYDFDMWQYGTAEVEGIEGECDVNISFVDFAKSEYEEKEELSKTALFFRVCQKSA